MHEQLTKPDAGIKDDLAFFNSGLHGRRDPFIEKFRDLCHRVAIRRLVLHRLRSALHMHEHDSGAGLRNHRSHFRIELQCAHVVDDGRPASRRPTGNRGFSCIDGDRHRHLTGKIGDHGNKPMGLVLSGTGCDPGLVNSAPISKRSAPSSIRRNLCSTVLPAPDICRHHKMNQV